MSHVSRSYNESYKIVSPKDDNYAPESVAAHTLLVLQILEAALKYHKMIRICGGYSILAIIDAVSRHDLPESEFGDQADNGERNEAAKREREARYQENFNRQSSSRKYRRHNKKVLKLLKEMENKSSKLGRMLYVADKIAAILATLQSEECGYIAKRSPDDSDDSSLTKRDREEMKLCERLIHEDGKTYCRASEMWTIDFLKIRRLNQHDDTGFFTALLVMFTLQKNGEWYKWREKDY